MFYLLINERNIVVEKERSVACCKQSDINKKQGLLLPLASSKTRNTVSQTTMVLHYSSQCLSSHNTL